MSEQTFIIGASVAGAKAAEELRAAGSSCSGALTGRGETPARRMPAGEQRAAVLGHHQLPGHHQVHPQMRVAVQIDDENLSAPGDPGEPVPDDQAVERAASDCSDNTSTDSTRRPSTVASNPRLTVSTSGSSGIPSVSRW